MKLTCNHVESNPAADEDGRCGNDASLISALREGGYPLILCPEHAEQRLLTEIEQVARMAKSEAEKTVQEIEEIRRRSRLRQEEYQNRIVELRKAIEEAKYGKPLP